MAARLASQVERLLGHRMPLASLFQASTVESLARMLQEEDWLPPWTSLVPLQPLGSKPPFFFVHGRGGDVFGFVSLARYAGGALREEIRSFQPAGFTTSAASRWADGLRGKLPKSCAAMDAGRDGRVGGHQASCRLPPGCDCRWCMHDFGRCFFPAALCSCSHTGMANFFRGRMERFFHLWRIRSRTPAAVRPDGQRG